MPFTLAHPAAVLPMRRFLWFPGLVAGSMAPDLAYYVPMPRGLGSAHLVVGLVGVDLALGILLVSMGYLALAPALALGPAAWRARVDPPDLIASSLRSARFQVRAAGSVVVGAATHLAWDSFTHIDGIAVRHWAPLRMAVIGPHRVYNVIGYVSSLGGMLLLVIIALCWFRRTPAEHGQRSHALPAPARAWIIAGTTAAAVVGAAHTLTDPISQISTYDWVRQLLIGSVQGAGMAAALYTLCWHLAARPGKTTPTP